MFEMPLAHYNALSKTSDVEKEIIGSVCKFGHVAGWLLKGLNICWPLNIDILSKKFSILLDIKCVIVSFDLIANAAGFYRLSIKCPFETFFFGYTGFTPSPGGISYSFKMLILAQQLACLMLCLMDAESFYVFSAFSRSF